MIDALFAKCSGMLAIDIEGHLAAGTSTNGASHKIPG